MDNEYFDNTKVTKAGFVIVFLRTDMWFKF